MIHAVIMAGGTGTRFWPLSRKKCPKQFLKIVTQCSLLDDTLFRLKGLVSSSETWIVTNQLYRPYFKHYRTLLPASHILYEPKGKNTAACIGWAAIELLKKDPDAIMLVLPSDHFISPTRAFRETLKIAIKCVVETDSLVTIGIKPTYPFTGYGYIEASSDSPARVLQFHEKPVLEKAEQYLAKGGFYWNSGMFVWRAQKILDLITDYLPQHGDILKRMAKVKGKLSASQLFHFFDEFESISIDYGVMEHVSDQTVLIPASFEWNDIGSWTALESFLIKDYSKNVIKGEAVTLDSTGNIVVSAHRTITLLDVHDMVVIDSPDAILVMPKSSDQKLRHLVQLLPSKLL